MLHLTCYYKECGYFNCSCRTGIALLKHTLRSIRSFLNIIINRSRFKHLDVLNPCAISCDNSLMYVKVTTRIYKKGRMHERWTQPHF